MTNATSDQDAELYVKADRLTSVGPLHVATGQDTDPSITFDHTGTIDIGPGESGAAGDAAVEHESEDLTVGQLSARKGAGSLKLRNGNGTQTVSLDASADAGKIELKRGSASDPDTTVTFGDTTDGGEFTVYDTPRNEAVVEGDVVPSGDGRLRLSDDAGRTTCRLLGSEGALVLSGPKESRSDGSLEDRAFGGGELIVQEEATTRDIHVHATAETDSDYGVDAGNRPRVFLDGPSATLELGREKVDADREAVSGNLILRDDRGSQLLTFNAVNEAGVVGFSWADDESVTACGSIAAVEDGLMVSAGSGTDALLITKLGEIQTASSIQRI
jgi:hypothetical protein